MRGIGRTGIGIGVLSVSILLSGIGAANAITIGGGLSEWGISNVTQGLVTDDAIGSPKTGVKNGVHYWEENGVGGNGYVSPGYGGQPFDIEGLYFTYDSSYLYFAAIAGMGPDGTWSGGTKYTMGDIALSFSGVVDPTAKPLYGYEYGIETRGTNAGRLYNVTGWTKASAFPQSNPVDICASSSSVASAGFVYEQLPGTNLWYIETKIARGTLFDPTLGDLNIHLTQTCGNDSADLRPEPVPEPATMLLLGTGLLGLGGVVRRKSKQG